MQPPLHISKIIPPSFPRILRRPRLLDRLDQHHDKKLILLLGQAAQGKSTLAMSYVSAAKIPSAWLNLGSEDSEAVNLFYLLVQSLQRVLPESDLSPLLVYPSLPAGPREEIPLYRNWLLSLLSRVQVPVQVIFDGLDQLSLQASAFRFLQVLLEVTPPHLHLLMLSREMPPLKVQELKIRQEAYIVRNHELAFTPKETRDYLNNVRKFLLPYDLIEHLHEITEGWIGGLVLLCEILERLPEASRGKFLSKEVSEKFVEEVSEYFAECILYSRADEIQDFLVKSSILDVVEPDFIKDFIGIDNAREILGGLSTQNLFVQPIFDKKRGWFYRYHRLFKDFLQAKFKEVLPAEKQVSVYFRAGSLLEERGDLESAVDFYLQAGATAQAVAAIERVGPQLLKNGKTAELARWLQSLPQALVQDKPWLLFFHHMTGRFTGAPEYFSSLQRAHSLFQQQQDLRGLLLTSAHLIEVALYLGHFDSLATQVNQAEELLQRVSPQAFPYESAVLWFRVGFGKMGSSDPRQGYRACYHAHLLAKKAGERHLEIYALIHAHLILSMLGDFTAAEESCQEVDKSLATWISPELQALQLICSCHLRMFQGEPEKAATLAKMAQEHGEKHGLTYLYPWTQLYRFMSLESLGRYEEAAEMGLSLLNFVSSMGLTHIFPALLVHLAILYYHQGDLLASKKFIQQARQVISTGGSTHQYHLSIATVVSGLIYYHLEELKLSIEQELQEVLQYANEVSSYLLMVDANWSLALWRWRQGKVKEAAAHLKTGMQIAGERGSYHSVYLSLQDLGRIFTLALELDVEEVWDNLPPLLSKMAAWVGPDLERLSRHGNPKIAARAWEICRAIHRQDLPRLQIQTLGGFRLRSEPGPVEGPVWEGNQPKLLLKALIAQGAVDVPKDVLIETLWPESSPEITEKNFRVSLHRLRKTLEPNLDKAFGSSYIHTERGLLSLDRELCRVDVNEFLARYEAGRNQEEQDNHHQALAQYKKAIAIYGGDFLPEELYLPWAEKRREELRGIYLELLDRVSRFYERRGALGQAIEYCKKIIQVDPVLEPTYRRLMTLYANRGMRSEALRTYQTCKQALARELDAEPEAVTTTIFRKIQESS
jgi:LuxR family maltose regulon positive regulatory protein